MHPASPTLPSTRVLRRVARAIARLTPLAFAMGACAPSQAPKTTAASDPSNPSAREGSAPHVARADLTRTAGEQVANVVYACPMHPEITSNEPGHVCPKCNMKLVPAK